MMGEQNESVEDVMARIIPPNHHCGPVIASAEAFADLEAAIERRRQAWAEKMPTQDDAIAQMIEAYRRLEDLGWKNATYCPKDGSSFDVIEAGSSGVHECIYMGDWPKGGWFVVAEGDLWPSRPILYRLQAQGEKTP